MSYERSGGDGSTVYCCPLCTRMELNSYEGWLWHLGSREHQTNHVKCREPFFNPRGPNRNEILNRCIDVHGILGLKIRELLEYFRTWGEIEDFSYWFKNEGEDGRAVRCVCLYKEKDAVDACVREEEHKLEGKKLNVERYRRGGGGGDRISGEKRKSYEDERGSGEKRKSYDDDDDKGDDRKYSRRRWD